MRAQMIVRFRRFVIAIVDRGEDSVVEGVERRRKKMSPARDMRISL